MVMRLSILVMDLKLERIDLALTVEEMDLIGKGIDLRVGDSGCGEFSFGDDKVDWQKCPQTLTLRGLVLSDGRCNHKNFLYSIWSWGPASNKNTPKSPTGFP